MPEFLALNPEGKVPVLLIDGQPLTEVAAILYWLARRFPEGGLWPEALDAQAEALSWMSFIAATIHAAWGRSREGARDAFELADARLGAGGWALGAYSVVDIHLFRLYWRFRGRVGPAPAGELQNLEAHYARMTARAAVQRTLSAEAAIGYELPV